MDKEQEFKNKRDAILSEMTYAEQNNILLQALLDATFENNSLLKELNVLKQTAIDNQAKFEKKWSGFKKVAVGTALIAPLLSMATGIIDPSQDFPVIIQRFNDVAGQLITVFKE